MKHRKIVTYALAGMIGCMGFVSCSTVNNISADVLATNYEKKIKKTSFLNRKLFKEDVKKKEIYEKIDIFLTDDAVNRPFEVIAFGAYTPLIVPIFHPEKKILEQNLYFKAARRAYNLNGDAIIVDSKNNFRVLKYK